MMETLSRHSNYYYIAKIQIRFTLFFFFGKIVLDSSYLIRILGERD